MAYWLRLLQNQGKEFLVGKTDLYYGFAKQQAGSARGWLVCEKCSSMFKFDRTIARECAVSGMEPPGVGPADAKEVMEKAVYARVMLSS